MMNNTIIEAKRRLKDISKDRVAINQRYYGEVIQCGEVVLNSCNITELERSRILGLMLNAYYGSYQYNKAEEIAILLTQCKIIHKLAYYSLAEYYSRTRRYDLCNSILNQAIHTYRDSDYLYYKYRKENNRRISCALNHQRGEYLPNPLKDREVIINKYLSFVKGLGVEITCTHRMKNTFQLNIIDTPNFNSFIAFDFETSGLSYIDNSPIEIGAIKVINGNIIESKEYTFQELIKPREGYISEFITDLTGITNRELEDAREMKDVMNDFFEWIGDLPLIGYNNKSFDNKFLAICGEACNYTISNNLFDVLLYARKLNLKCDNYKLTTVANYLDVSNPNAHRALYDAITTAKVLLKLKNNN